MQLATLCAFIWLFWLAVYFVCVLQIRCWLPYAVGNSYFLALLVGAVVSRQRLGFGLVPLGLWTFNACASLSL